MDEFRAFFTATLNGRSVQRLYLYDLDQPEPYLELRYLSGTRIFTQRFSVKLTITEDTLGNKIAKFTEILPSNTHFSRRGLLPFLEYITRDSGFYIQKRANLNATQNTIGLIAVDDFTLLSHWYDF
ncbi:hypothetical protein JL193_04895 [Polaribacter batillariae]|uniref:Uncharacterized protein n=1 Tax=Polaribacter batillariae TaxID=2808900 RepID=A0ABX7SWI6_9FLAO|nr:hypothetical protein [Polaribacter batillariae]QTD38617.1 hypothetical protein JL193_04895 [Polaribacter batillariae]